MPGFRVFWNYEMGNGHLLLFSFAEGCGMGVLLVASRIYLPGFIRRQKIIQLFQITAAAFECPPPTLAGLGYEECLRQFAMFTREGSERAIERKDELPLKSRLYQATFP